MSKPDQAEDRLFAALAYPYWFVAFPVFMLGQGYRQRRFLRYHMFHGLALGLLIFWGGLVSWTLAAAIGKFAPIFSLLFYPLIKIAEWLAFGMTVWGAGNAFVGREVELPFITEFVRPYLADGDNVAPKG